MADPHSASNLTITQCVTLKLKDDNYLIRKLQFEQFLSSQMLLGYVTGATPRPQETIPVRQGDQVTEPANLDFVPWVQKDQLIMAWIYGTLSENALRSVYGLHSSQEVWCSLGQKYNRVSATRKLVLQRKIQTLSKGDKTMYVYLSEIKTLCDQLDSIGAAIPESEKIFGMLNGLGRDYESICAVIENSMDSVPAPSLDDVMSKLIPFDDKLQTYTASSDVTPHQAFYSDRGGYSGCGRGQHRGGYRGRGYSTQGRGFYQQFGQSGGRGTQQNSSRPTCQICGKYGHAAFKCYKRFDLHFQPSEPPQANTVMRSIEESGYGANDWYPDTAATHHITNSTQHLESTQPYSGTDVVIVGNGDFLPITHVGSIVLPSLSGTLPLNEVLVCPSIMKSLLSVSKLTDDYPCEFTFDSHTVLVKDKKNHQLLSRGSKRGGLYRLENSQFLAFYSSRQQSGSDEIWHKRL